MNTVKCPTCNKEVLWSSDNIFRPFCSKRCHLIDLGAWANEEYSIPVKELPTSDTLTTEPTE